VHATASRDGISGPDPVVFFFGAMSPYSWFAAERIGRLLPDATWRPVFAGGLFKGAERRSWGFDERRAAGIADCEARALAHGLGPIRWPQPWPTVDLAVGRAMVVADQEGVLRDFALSAMRLAFLEARDLGQPDAVAEAARRVGMDPDAVIAAAAESSVKDALRARTDDALAMGVVGIPTVAVGSQLFWGDDRLEEAVSARQGSG
jgi:2-hydroxychromene-2-carboxylate isomerase